MRLGPPLLAVAMLARCVLAAGDAEPPAYQIPQLNRIKIDGDGADWRDKGFRIDVLAPADGVIVPSTDFDAVVRVGWDERGLLLLLNVVDDTLREADDDAKLDEGDSVQLSVADRGMVLFDVVIAPGVDDVHNTQRIRVTPGMRADPKVGAESRRTRGGYCMEALIPLAALHVPNEGPAVRGSEFQLQVVVNDSDHPGGRKRHVWLTNDEGESRFRNTRPLMLGVTASPPVTAAAVAQFLELRAIRVTVLTVAQEFGKRVEVSDGPSLKDIATTSGVRLPIAMDNIRRISDRHGTYMNIPLPPLGLQDKPLNVYVDSKLVARVTPPDVDARRRIALSQIDLKFKPAVFAGDAFPACDFADRARARELIGGGYTLKPTFYDAEYNPGDKPAKPGRYGAIVEITTDAGIKLPPRLLSLFKQKDASPWREQDLSVQLALPPQLGLDPQVVKEQQPALAQYVKERLTDDFAAEPDAALLLAALAECKPGDGQLGGRDSIWARDQRWWYPLKQQLGLDKYRYLVDLPPGYHKDPNAAPVLLFLHGSGERGDDLAQVRAHGPPRLALAGKPLPFIVVSPQCPAGEWWSAQQLGTVLNEVVRKYHVDRDRVYVTGLSMGGYGAWELAAEYPDVFAAIVPICGAGGVADVGRLKHLPSWIFHGQRDTAVPFARSQEMFDALAALKAPVKFTPYPDAGHDAWTATYDNPELYKWLLEQKRPPTPK